MKCAENKLFWKWGEDNLFPCHLAKIYLNSAPHRRIINDKADFIAGKGFVCDEENTPLKQLIRNVNGHHDSLRVVTKKLALDKCLFGNAFLEIVTDQRQQFISLYHQDASKCRLAKDKKSIILHHNWKKFNEKEAVSIPVYPDFKKDRNGYMHSVIHYKEYEPMFENYGLPQYVAGMEAAVIGHKTDKWNIARLDNAFQLSGVMILDGDVDTETEAQQLSEVVNKKFAGNPGQVMFIVKNSTQNENSKFIPFSNGNEGDWKNLHEQSNTDTVIAHSWFRALSGLDYTSGFSTERIINEYQVALHSFIEPQQKDLIEPIKNVLEHILDIDAASLAFINKPPVTVKPGYMKVWEARKIDGLDYDPNDKNQQIFIANL